MSHEKARQIIREMFYFNKDTAHLHFKKSFKHYKQDYEVRGHLNLFIAGRYYTDNEILWLYHRDTIQHSICTVPWMQGDDRTRLIDMPKSLNRLLYQHAYKEQCAQSHIYYYNARWKALLQYNGKQTYLGTFEREKDAFNTIYNKRLEILKQELPKYTETIFCNVEEAGRKGPFYLPPAKEVKL